MPYSFEYLSLVSRVRSSANLAAELRRLIQSGQIQDGEVLPPERFISDQCDLSRGTVRKALGELESEGLVTGGQGRLRRVCGPSSAEEKRTQQAIIALMWPDPQQHWKWQKAPGWQCHINRGAMDALENTGKHKLLLDPVLLDENVPMDWLLNLGVEGVITDEMTADDPLTVIEMLKYIRRLGLPVVAYSNELWARMFDRVVPDHRQGAHQLTQWLIEQGKTNIQRLWLIRDYTQRPDWLSQRDTGFEQAMAENGLQAMPPVELILHKPLRSSSKQFDNLKHLIAGNLARLTTEGRKIDTIMLTTDGDVPACAAACRVIGKDPQRDIALVGYDNFWHDLPDLQYDSTPPLATVDKHNYQAGREMVQLYNERLNGLIQEEIQVRMIAPELLIL